MFARKITTTGPSDKVIVANNLYHGQFVDGMVRQNWLAHFPGFLGIDNSLAKPASGNNPSDLITSIIQVVFDTEENAIANSKVDFSTIEGFYLTPTSREEMKQYRIDNGITWVEEIVPFELA